MLPQFMKKKIPFSCDRCEATLTFKENLNRNIVSLQEGNKLFKCDDCDASFSTRFDLERHVASVHDGKKIFSCDRCIATL